MPVHVENERQEFVPPVSTRNRRVFNDLSNKKTRHVVPGSTVKRVCLNNLTQQHKPAAAPAFQVYVDPENRPNVNENSGRRNSRSDEETPTPRLQRNISHRGRSFSTTPSSGRTTMRGDGRRHSTPEGSDHNRNQEPILTNGATRRWSNVTFAEEDSVSGSERSRHSHRSFNGNSIRSLSNSSVSSAGSDSVFSPFGYDERQGDRFTFDHCVYDADSVRVGAGRQLPQRTRKSEIPDACQRSRSLGESTTLSSIKRRRHSESDEQQKIGVLLTPSDLQYIANAHRLNRQSSVVIHISRRQILPRPKLK